MKKFLHSDWLREMQFLINTVQNRGNSVQKVLIRCKLQIMEKVFSAPWLSLIFEVPYYGQLTAVKTRYPLTSIT